MPFRIKVSLAILLAIFTLIIFGPFFAPVRPLKDTLPATQLADPDSKFAEVNGLSVHYKTSDVVPANDQLNFVLLHGFGASTYSWHAVMDTFGQYGHVVAFDRPGFGLTERPLRGDWKTQQENPYTAEAQVNLTLGLMDKLGMTKAILVGHSAGGSVAAQIALEHPERVAGVIFVDASIYDARQISWWRKFLYATPQLNRVGPLFMRQLAGKPGQDFLKAAWSDDSLLTQDIIDAYQKPFKVDNWDKALWEVSKAGSVPNLGPEIPQITVPTLVISGADDKIVPTTHSEHLAKDLPNSQMALFDGCGHIPQEECPVPFLEVVANWLVTQNFLKQTP